MIGGTRRLLRGQDEGARLRGTPAGCGSCGRIHSPPDRVQMAGPSLFLLRLRLS